MYIVHASAALFVPAIFRIHAHMVCHSPLKTGGNPSFGAYAAASGGTIPLIELIVGTITPGCVRKIIKNVPAYPKPIVFCVETT